MSNHDSPNSSSSSKPEDDELDVIVESDDLEVPESLSSELFEDDLPEDDLSASAYQGVDVSRSHTRREYLPSGGFIEERDRFDLSQAQEETRAKLAMRLLWLLVGTLVATTLFIIGVELRETFTSSSKDSSPAKDVVKLGDDSFVYIVREQPASKGSKDLINLIWTTQVTLVSGALGFYFGAKDVSK